MTHCHFSISLVLFRLLLSTHTCPSSWAMVKAALKPLSWNECASNNNDVEDDLDDAVNTDEEVFEE